MDQLGADREIEAFGALARYAPETASRLPAVLDQIDLIDLDQPIRTLARTVTPATVCPLMGMGSPHGSGGPESGAPGNGCRPNDRRRPPAPSSRPAAIPSAR